MKTIKVALMALALFIGIGAAFANRSTHQQAKKAFTGVWQDTNPDGSLISTLDGGNVYATEADAEEATSCEAVTSDVHCAASVTQANGTETGSFIFAQN